MTSKPPSGPVSPSFAETHREDSDQYYSFDSDTDEQGNVGGIQERLDKGAGSEARIIERVRIAEAAGLIVKKHESPLPPPKPRPRPRRRPRPLTPSRDTKPGRDSNAQDNVPETPMSPLGLEDAYDRYENFRSIQSQSLLDQQQRYSMVSNSSVDSRLDTPGSPTTTASLSLAPSDGTSGTSIGGMEQRIGSVFHNLFGHPKPTPTIATSSRRVSISSPIISRPMSPGQLRDPFPRASSPTFGTSWSSLVAKDVLDGIPDHERKRQEAIFELINTENAYVRDLQLIVEVFYSSMMPLLDEKANTVIFANVEDILLTNTGFLSSLEQRQRDCRLYIDHIGDILASHMSNMAVYTPYCVNQAPAIKILQSVRSGAPEVNACLQRLRDGPLVRNLDLSSYLLIPMQRITRYPLLIRQVLHYTEGDEERRQLEGALLTAESILDSINESVRDREGAERLAAVSQNLFIGQGHLDLTAPTKFMGSRKLLKEGLLTKAKSGRKLQAFLCNDILVLTEATIQSLYRMPIPLSELQVDEIGKDEMTFQLSMAYPRGGGSIGLKASSVKEQQAWIDAILRAGQHCRSAERKAMRRISRRRKTSVRVSTATMAESDPLLALRQAVKAKSPISYLKDSEAHSTLAGATHIVISSTLSVPKLAATRWRRPEQPNANPPPPPHLATDPNAEPDRFFTIDAILLTWLAKDSPVAEYMKQARDVHRYVPLTERKSIVDWLDGKAKDSERIAPLTEADSTTPKSPTTSSANLPQPSSTPSTTQYGTSAQAPRTAVKRAHVPDAADIDMCKKIKANEIELRDRTSVLRGVKINNFAQVKERAAQYKTLIKNRSAGPASSSQSSNPNRAKKQQKIIPLIMVSSAPTALITLYNIKKFLEESVFEPSETARARQGKSEELVAIYRKRQFIGPGGKQEETKMKYFAVDTLDALGKFGQDPWDRVVCVVTTGQEWQFKSYKWSEPRQLFHNVKGIHFTWTNDGPNPRTKDWNVSELKIDPHRRHVDKSVVAQFWKSMDSWMAQNKPSLLS